MLVIRLGTCHYHNVPWALKNSPPTFPEIWCTSHLLCTLVLHHIIYWSSSPDLIGSLAEQCSPWEHHQIEEMKDCSALQTCGTNYLFAHFVIGWLCRWLPNKEAIYQGCHSSWDTIKSMLYVYHFFRCYLYIFPSFYGWLGIGSMIGGLGAEVYTSMAVTQYSLTGFQKNLAGLSP